MDRTTLLTILVALLLGVSAMEAIQLANLNSGFEKISASKSSNAITLGAGQDPSAGSGSAQQTKATPAPQQQSGGQAPALSQIANLPDMVGGC